MRARNGAGAGGLTHPRGRPPKMRAGNGAGAGALVQAVRDVRPSLLLEQYMKTTYSAESSFPRRVLKKSNQRV